MMHRGREALERGDTSGQCGGCPSLGATAHLSTARPGLSTERDCIRVYRVRLYSLPPTVTTGSNSIWPHRGSGKTLESAIDPSLSVPEPVQTNKDDHSRRISCRVTPNPGCDVG